MAKTKGEEKDPTPEELPIGLVNPKTGTSNGGSK